MTIRIFVGWMCVCVCMCDQCHFNVLIASNTFAHCVVQCVRTYIQQSEFVFLCCIKNVLKWSEKFLACGFFRLQIMLLYVSIYVHLFHLFCVWFFRLFFCAFIFWLVIFDSLSLCFHFECVKINFATTTNRIEIYGEKKETCVQRAISIGDCDCNSIFFLFWIFSWIEIHIFICRNSKFMSPIVHRIC